jgi:hypothetical protein
MDDRESEKKLGVEVELVGGEFDGLTFLMSSELEVIDVPLAFNYEGKILCGVEMLQYEWTGRSSVEGRPLYQFLRHVAGTFTVKDLPQIGG